MSSIGLVCRHEFMDTQIKEFVEIGSLAYDHIHSHSHKLNHKIAAATITNTVSDEERIALFSFFCCMYWDARSK